jgi:hypothetical protein
MWTCALIALKETDVRGAANLISPGVTKHLKRIRVIIADGAWNIQTAFPNHPNACAGGIAKNVEHGLISWTKGHCAKPAKPIQKRLTNI